MRIRTLAAALCLGAAAAVGAAPAAGADSSWVPYSQADITVPGERSTCGFDVLMSVVEDEEFYKNVELYADGTPKRQLWRGPLVMRYTNLQSGESVVRDLSAMATMDYREDGSLASIRSVHGAFGATMPAGSQPGTGLYVLGGHGTTVTFESDGSRSFTLGPNGTAENVCEAID